MTVTSIVLMVQTSKLEVLKVEFPIDSDIKGADTKWTIRITYQSMLVISLVMAR